MRGNATFRFRAVNRAEPVPGRSEDLAGAPVGEVAAPGDADAEVALALLVGWLVGEVLQYRPGDAALGVIDQNPEHNQHMALNRESASAKTVVQDTPNVFDVRPRPELTDMRGAQEPGEIESDMVSLRATA